MVLKIQNWLRNNNGNFQLLEQQLGITATFHPTDDRVILNYSQINSPKTNDIVRECRGLILNKNTFDIIAKSFDRFFNLGEVASEDNKFVWDGSIATHKEDGSLILLYYYNNHWCVNTRNSFASMPVNGLTFTWRDLFFSALGDIDILDRLCKDDTYVFELCSPYTQVVRIYTHAQVYLLSIFHNPSGCEMTHKYTSSVGVRLGLCMPQVHSFNEPNDVADYIYNKSRNDRTFEGCVVRDCMNHRLKIKSEDYIRLHRLNNNGNVALPRSIAKIILDNEQDEVLTYYPALKPDFDAVKLRIDKMLKEMDNLWFCHWDEVSPRKFAEYVGKAKLSSILFAAKKANKNPTDLLTEDQFKDKIITIIDREYKVKLKEKK